MLKLDHGSELCNTLKKEVANMFKLIHGGADRRRQRKAELYLKALDRTACALRDKPEDKLLQMRTVFYGVRYVVAAMRGRPASKELISRVVELVGQLTPRELLQIFPVEKVYNGERWETKDYFFTMDVLRKHGLDKPLGADVCDVLWDYTNTHVRLFNVAMMNAVDALRRMAGQDTLLLEWAEGNGVKLTTYTMAKDSKGRRCMINTETGERCKVKARRPRWARVQQKHEPPRLG